MLALEHVSKSYGSNVVLKEFSLRTGAEEIVCLLGPSGCGKTTMLNLIARLIPADSGLVSTPAGRIGYAFQEPRLLPWQTARQNLGLGLRATGVPPRERDRLVDTYLEQLGLGDAGELYPHELSGGMRQRVAFGRALAIDPAYLLLDEPLRSVDVSLRLRLLSLLLTEWTRRPRAVLFVTHDTLEAALCGQRILVLGSSPMSVRAELRPHAAPEARRPGDEEVMRTQAALYALLAEDQSRP